MSGGKWKVPLVMRATMGATRRSAAQHSQSLHAWLCHIPGLKVVMPSTPYDAKGLWKTAIRDDNPVVIFEDKMMYQLKGPVPAEPYEIEFGQARVAREGRDVTVVAIALMVQRSLAAAEHLASEGISVEVVDPRTVSPLDTGTILASVKKTGRLLVVDEAFSPCSLGAEIAARVADAGFDDLDAPIRRLNGAFAPTPYSPPLEKAVIPQVEDIVKAIRELTEE